MPYRIPDWLSQIANDNPNLVEDSPTFRAVEETQQKKNLVKATNQALQQHAEEVKQQQLKAITGQLQAIKQLKDQTDHIHKNLPDFGTQAKAKSDQILSGPANNTPPKDPNTLPGPGDEPRSPPVGDNPPVMPGMQTQPYAPDTANPQPGNIPGNKFMPDQPPAPDISPPGATPFQPNPQQQMAQTPPPSGDPSQNMSVEDVMALSHSTGLSPQQVASMILMGDNVLKNQPPSPPTPAPQGAPPLPFAA